MRATPFVTLVVVVVLTWAAFTPIFLHPTEPVWEHVAPAQITDNGFEFYSEQILIDWSVFWSEAMKSLSYLRTLSKNKGAYHLQIKNIWNVQNLVPTLQSLNNWFELDDFVLSFDTYSDDYSFLFSELPTRTKNLTITVFKTDPAKEPNYRKTVEALVNVSREWREVSWNTYWKILNINFWRNHYTLSEAEIQALKSSGFETVWSTSPRGYLKGTNPFGH